LVDNFEMLLESNGPTAARLQKEVLRNIEAWTRMIQEGGFGGYDPAYPPGNRMLISLEGLAKKYQVFCQMDF
jgi:hypothetical protein